MSGCSAVAPVQGEEGLLTTFCIVAEVEGVGVDMVDFICCDSQSGWCQGCGITAFTPPEPSIGSPVTYWAVGCVNTSQAVQLAGFILSLNGPITAKTLFEI